MVQFCNRFLVKNTCTYMPSKVKNRKYITQRMNRVWKCFKRNLVFKISFIALPPSLEMQLRQFYHRFLAAALD